MTINIPERLCFFDAVNDARLKASSPMNLHAYLDYGKGDLIKSAPSKTMKQWYKCKNDIC